MQDSKNGAVAGRAAAPSVLYRAKNWRKNAALKKIEDCEGMYEMYRGIADVNCYCQGELFSKNN